MDWAWGKVTSNGAKGVQSKMPLGSMKGLLKYSERESAQNTFFFSCIA
jgi:hypothetical protein